MTLLPRASTCHIPEGSAVFATLADRQYVEPAKQLFASLHYNAGWRGDRLLLAHEIAEGDLRWFEERGILVHRCAPLFSGRPGGMPPVLTSKLHLFAPELRRWQSVIYCDADATVRASLDGLLPLRGFWSIRDASRFLDVQIASRAMRRKRGIASAEARPLLRELRRRVDFLATPFCAGFFVFSADAVDGSDYDALHAAIARYHPISAYGDQLAFNLVFYGRWQALSPVYNIQLNGERNQWDLRPEEVDGIVLHYISPEKPWLVRNHFYREWAANLDRADAIDAGRIPEGKRWTDEAIEQYSRYLEARDRRPVLIGAWASSRFGPRYRRLTWKLAGAILAVRRVKWRLAERWSGRPDPAHDRSTPPHP